MTLWPLPPGKQIQPKDVQPPPRFTIRYGSGESERLSQMENGVGKGDLYDERNPYVSVMKSNERITAKDWVQDVRHCVFDIQNSGISYSPGDIVYIMPKNPKKAVQVFLNLLSLDGEKVIHSIEPLNTADPVPSVKFPIKISDLFTNYLDFLGTPRRYFYELLSFFATEEREKERLKHFSSREGFESLYEYNFQAKRSFVDVFSDFPSCKPPLEYLLDLIPPLNPRPFSISSAQKCHPSEIHVTMLVVSYTSPINRIKKGLCSNWLANMKPEEAPKVELWVKKGPTSLPPDSDNTPIIMIGPGTGCAIFRAYVEYNYYLHLNGKPTRKMMFLFGCRKRNSDFFYEEEWNKYVSMGVISHFAVAFSRDQDKKNYVTHKMNELSSEIWNYLQQNCIIYISGKSGNMPRDVKRELTNIISQHAQLDTQQAENYIANLIKQNRYLTETWL
uniref:FAD-binding FR-type domain-containing protein n=1 Tax=Arcella intermedia TaxID=1963864 RepID=A0A6B2L3V5_9EUKA